MNLLRWTDGKLYEVPEGELERALNDGFKVPTQAEYARHVARGQPLQAAAEAGARGISFGLTDRGLNDPMAALRREENPVAAFAGEVTGALATTPVTGAAVAPVKSLAGRLAAEGGLFGLGTAVSEAALGDTELTAEKLLAGAAGGAAGGALFGGAAAGAGAVARKVANALGGDAARNALNSAAARVWKAELATKAQLRKYNTQGFWDDIVDFGVREGILHKGTTFESGMEAAQAAVARRSGDLGDMLTRLEGKSPLQSHAGQLRKRLESALAPLTKRPSMAAAVERELEVALKLVEPGHTWQDLWSHASDLWKTLPKEVAPEGSAAVRNTIRAALKDMAFDADVALLKDAPAFLRQKNKELAQAYRLESMFTEKVLAADATSPRLGELVYRGSVGTLAGGPLGGAAAVGAELFGGKVKERAGFVAAGLLRDLGGSAALPQIAEQFKRVVEGKIASGAAGAFLIPLQQASARGAMDLLDTHLALAQSKLGPEYMATMGLEPEREGELAHISGRAAAMSAVRARTESFDRQINTSVKRVLAGAEPVSQPDPPDLSSVQKQLERMLVDPQSVFEAVPTTASGALPAVMTSLAATQLKAAQFLMGRMPKSPYEGLPPALQRPWKPTQAALREWGDYLHAVQNPSSILDSAAAGRLTRAQRDVLGEVYPKLQMEIQNKLIEQLATHTKPLTVKQRRVISGLLGGLTLEPQMLLAIQAVHATVKATKGPGRPDGRQSITVEDNLETQAQRLEER